MRIVSDRTRAGCGPAASGRLDSGRAGNSATVTPVETGTGLACSGFKRAGGHPLTSSGNGRRLGVRKRLAPDRGRCGIFPGSGQPPKLCQNAPMLRPAGRCQRRVPQSTTPGEWLERGMLAASQPTPCAWLRRGSHRRGLPDLAERVLTKTRPVFSRVPAVRNGNGVDNSTRHVLIVSTEYGAPRERAEARNSKGKAMSRSTASFWKSASRATRHPALPGVPSWVAVRSGYAVRSMAPSWGTSLDPFLARRGSYVHRLL